MDFKLWLEGHKQYYHGSQKKFPNGFLLLPQTDGYVLYPETTGLEAFVEKYRPSNKLARSKSVFLVDNPELCDLAGGYEDYIYLVRPQGVIEASDLSWYSQIETYLDMEEEEKKQCALNYWNGVPFTDRRRRLVEYRTPAAKIIQLFSSEESYGI